MRRFLLALVAVQALAADRPNILWLVGENLQHEIGCYGAKLVQTPNLDRLAAEGVRFMRVFSTSPVCAPSRSAFFTGMYQTTTDTHHMRSHRTDDFRLPEGVRPITHWLRDAGYFTANIKTIGERNVGTGKLDFNFANEGPIYESDDWSALKSRQPFFAVVNSHEVEYDIYDRQSAKKERVEWVGEREHPRIATPENVTPPPYYPDHPVVRAEWARYLNSVSGMDRRIGWVLEKLRADGLDENTVVMFFADNGRLEARGIHWCYDSGLHVPMIVRWPDKRHAGTVNEQVVSVLDVAATTLAIAGVPRPPLMQSRDIFGDPPREYAFSARDRIDETALRIRSVRDARWRYIRNFTPGPTFASLNRYKEKCFLILPLMRELHTAGKLTGASAELMERRGPGEELYDTAADPHEIRNLAADPQHHATLLRLRAALDVWMIETKDRGEVAEPAGVVAPFEKEMHEWFGTPAWAEKSLSVAAVLRDENALARAHDIEVRDGIAYVAGKAGSLAIVDVKQPAAPRILWSVRDAQAYEDAETVLPLSANRLLVGTRDLHLFDVTTPAQPRLLASIKDRPRVDLINGFARRGDVVFGANKSGHVIAVDVSAPDKLRVLGTRDGLASPHDVALSDDLLVVADANGFGANGKPGRLAVYRIAGPPDEWTLLGMLEDPRLAGANRVRTRGRIAYVGCSLSPKAPRGESFGNNVSIVDLADPAKPRLRSRIDFPDARGPNGLELVGSVIFAAGGATVQAIDVSNPDAPRELARFTSAEAFPGGADDAHDLVFDRGHLFVTAQSTHALVILAVSGPVAKAASE